MTNDGGGHGEPLYDHSAKWLLIKAYDICIGV